METTQDTKNIFDSIPGNLTEEVFESIIKSSNINIERIISNGQTSPETGWYDQDDAEWILILRGEAIIIFENEDQLKLIEGSYLNIPAHTKHQVSWTSGQTETIWLAIHYSD